MRVDLLTKTNYKMKRIQILLTSFLLFIITACGVSVYTVNPNKNDLSNYKSFAYLPNTNLEIEAEKYNDTVVNKKIVETVKTNMEENGLKLNQENPELLVLISTSADIDIDVQSSHNFATYPYEEGPVVVSPEYEPYYYYEFNTVKNIEGYNTSTFTHEEGALVIDLIDAETQKTVWKGVAVDRIYDDPSTEVIQDLVGEIFDEFPVKNKDA